jgi:hypothetical protein
MSYQLTFFEAAIDQSLTASVGVVVLTVNRADWDSVIG